MEPELIKEKDAAKFLQVPCKTLQSWRLKGYGPSFVRLGKPGGKRGVIRYPLQKLQMYAATGTGI